MSRIYEHLGILPIGKSVRLAKILRVDDRIERIRVGADSLRLRGCRRSISLWLLKPRKSIQSAGPGSALGR